MESFIKPKIENNIYKTKEAACGLQKTFF